MTGFRVAATLATAAVVLAGCNETAMVEVAQEDAAGGTPQEICVSAVAEQVEEVDVAVLETITPTSDTVATVVTVGVGMERTPWRCTVSAQGVVTEVVAVAS